VTVDLRPRAAVAPVEQFAVQLVLILRVGSTLRFIDKLASGSRQSHIHDVRVYECKR
jgi:hypothetical protein